MPKPTNKNDLLAAIEKEFKALESFLTLLPPSEKDLPGAIGPWSAKDVLAHLYEWQQLFLGWYHTGLEGNNPAMPAEGFKWNETPRLNGMIYQKYHQLPLEEVIQLLHQSHHQVINLVESLSDSEIFNVGNFAWTKKLALSSYLIPCTSSHYHWAHTEMRKGLKK